MKRAAVKGTMAGVPENGAPTRRDAQEVLSRCAGKRVLVVGDLMLDRYVCGKVTRISPEAPVPVVEVTDEHALPGGAANVARNVQALGGKAIVAGVVGRDDVGRELLGLLADEGIAADGVIPHETFQTAMKTRILAERQQVVRVDRECRREVLADQAERMAGQIAELAEDAAAVIIEDYGKGVVTQQAVDAAVRTARRRGIPVALDPKEGHDLRVEALTLATPNYREACWAAGVAAQADVEEETLRRVGETLRAKWHVAVLIVTLGPLGMYVVAESGPATVIAAEAREVFDVSGAGDTVIAAALLSLLGGASPLTAATLANHAAGVVVGKLGAATCSTQELLKAIG